MVLRACPDASRSGSTEFESFERTTEIVVCPVRVRVSPVRTAC
jgi:hypothetical protein